jgi:CheY-like chemotaxis protein
MDSFQRCRLASEKVSWNFEVELGDLEFDFGRSFLPSRLCGVQLPEWMTDEQRRTLNQIRGYSYAHLFFFFEEFIIRQTCESATGYVHNDPEALSALLNFANEETKHQRMFELTKDLLAGEFGFRPGELPGRVEVAKAVCQNSPFAVYLLILMIEWFTQRHYIECFAEEEAELDPGFVKIFRLHWTEEAQHARLDSLELTTLAGSMDATEIKTSVEEFVAVLRVFEGLLRQQGELDFETYERVIGESVPAGQREELLEAMHREFLWTFIVSGLEHKAFQAAYQKVVPQGVLSVLTLAGEFGSALSAEPAGPKFCPPPESADREVPDVGVVLVVDDHESIRELARPMLERLGFTVLVAQDGEEALKVFAANADDVQLVLLDLTMPGMAGDEVLEVIHRSHPDLPVILSSGHMRSDALSGTSVDRLSGYLQKPYRGQELARLVADVLGLSD